MPKKLTRRPYRPRDPLQEAAEVISDRLVDAVDILMDRVLGKVFPEIASQPQSRPPRPPRPQTGSSTSTRTPPSSRPHNLYDDLEVSPYASQETIAAAWKSLSKRYHPDVNKSKDASERIKRINAAYSILSKEDSRKAYDRLMGLRATR